MNDVDLAKKLGISVAALGGLTPDGVAFAEYEAEEPERRNAIIEECIAAVEGLSEQCADLIESGTESEAPQHRNHRQAYIQAIQRLESLREGHYLWPAVRPERLQADLFKRIDAFVRDPQTHNLLAEQGVTDPSSVAAMCVWTIGQLKDSAETRAKFLLP